MKHICPNKLGVYQGSRKGKARRFETSCTLPYADPAEKPSLLEGVGELSFLFCEEEEEVMKEQCSRKQKGLEVEEDDARRKQKRKSVLEIVGKFRP